MTKKLKIIGPYTPEHPGPFCTRDGRPARIICTDRMGDTPIVALIDDKTQELNRAFCSDGKYHLSSRDFDLMNAEEVPVVREFWVNEYADGTIAVFFSKTGAEGYVTDQANIRTIHVREVLPGDGE